MKESYAIELDLAQVRFLKTRFKVKTDAELRDKLQEIAEALINKQFICSLDKGEGNDSR